jgi:hypothetical protein
MSFQRRPVKALRFPYSGSNIRKKHDLACLITPFWFHYHAGDQMHRAPGSRYRSLLPEYRHRYLQDVWLRVDHFP